LGQLRRWHAGLGVIDHWAEQRAYRPNLYEDQCVRHAGRHLDCQWHQQPRDNNRHFNAQFGGITEARSFINRSGQFTAVDVPGLPVVQGDGISNNGTIVGWASTSGNCQRHGFVRSAQGRISRLDIALAFDTFLTGVKDEALLSDIIIRDFPAR
jgi:hypothetical protein